MERVARVFRKRLALGSCLLLAAVAPQPGAALSRNVIFFIGDGMGFEQVKAARYYNDGPLTFEDLPHQGQVTTHSADSSITDSGAAATAMATGTKVDNRVISVADPGDGSELETVLEICRDLDMSTGLVTTTQMTHATPAAFGAHEPSRDNRDAIADDYLSQTRPNLLLGGGTHMSESAAMAAGYTVVTDRAVLQLLDTQTETRVSGQFGEDHLPYEYDGDYSTLPHLSEMTAVALDILDDDPEGFFLMVEGGRIDHAGEDNELERNVFETIEFAHAVQVARDWAGNRRDTLILVTADHEAGGLTVLEGEDAQGFPNVSWSTTGHTGVDVPVYAWGTHAERVDGVMDNTDLFRLAVSAVPEPSSPHLQLVALATLGLCVRFTASRSAAAGEAG